MTQGMPELLIHKMDILNVIYTNYDNLSYLISGFDYHHILL